MVETHYVSIIRSQVLIVVAGLPVRTPFERIRPAHVE